MIVLNRIYKDFPVMIVGYELQNEEITIFLKKIKNENVEKITLLYLQNKYVVDISESDNITMYKIKTNNANVIGDIKIISGLIESKEKEIDEEITIVKPKSINFLGREKYLFIKEFVKRNKVDKEKVKYIPFKGDDYWNCSCGEVNFENEKCVECGLNRNDVCSVNTVFNKEAYETNEKLKYMKDILMWIVIGYITSIFLQILFGDFLLNNETKNNFFGILNRFILPITMIFSTIFEWYFTSKYAEKAQKTLRIINYSILIYFNFLMMIITLKIAYIFIFLVAIDVVYGYTLIKNYKNKIVNNSHEKIIILGCLILGLISSIKVSIFSKYDMTLSSEGLSLNIKTSEENYIIPNTIDENLVYKISFDENYSYKIKKLHINKALKVISIKSNNVLSKLEKITIDDDSIMTVSKNVLYNENGKIVLVPKTVTYIEITKDVDDYSIAYALGLEEVYIHKDVESIGLQAFEGCENLKKISFEEGSKLKEIKDKAFYECKSLKDFVCPISVQKIGDAALSGCNEIEYVKVPFTGNQREDDPKNVFALDLFVRLFGGTADKDYNVVPQSLVRIEVYDVKLLHNGTFYGLKNVKEIILPKTMEYMGVNMFYNCKSLESFSIPQGITIISEGMFDGCESLSTIYISKAVKVIEKNAFRNCKNLKEIIYEGNINDIEIKEGNEILK